MRIGPYEVTAELGRGGAGVVYAAGPDVAVKVLTSGTPDLLVRELRTLATLQHPGIVRILDHGLQEGRPWIAMERIHGPTLQERLGSPAPIADASTFSLDDPFDAPRPPVSDGLPQRLRHVKRLCRTLAWLHGEGVVHRDLKPANVLLRGEGDPVLVDFGISAGFGGRESVRGIDRISGTLGYLAPEQARGELVDARADLYAVGCILWACVTGRPPLDASRPAVALQQLQTWEPVPPSLEVDGVPPELDALIVGLLQPDPADRPGHADEVVDALDALGVHDDARGLPAARPRLYRPPLVGRSEALDTLRQVLVEGRKRGSLVLVVSEPGLGSSRMLAEAVLASRRMGFAVVTGACDSDRQETTPLHPLSGLLGRLASATDLQVDDVLRPWLTGPVPAEAADPWAVPQSLVRATRALSLVRPLLVVLDDLHHADETTGRWLSVLATELAVQPSPVVVIGSMDPTRATGPMRALASTLPQVQLGRLDAFALRELASGMLAAPVPASLPVPRAEGSPVLLAELLLSGIDEGWLYRRGHRWCIDTASDVPATIADLAAARIATLDPEGRHYAAAAAALAELLTEERLLALGCTPSILHCLLRARVLERDADGLRFPHGSLRLAALERVAPDELCELHAVIADLAARVGAPSAWVARHLDAAGQDATALWLLAARELQKRGAPLEARAITERLDASGRATADSELLRAETAGAVLDTEAVLQSCRAAAALDPSRAAEADVTAGTALQRAGRSDEASPFLERAARAGGRAGLEARIVLAFAPADLGEPDSGIAMALAAATEARSLGDTRLEADALNTAGRCAFAALRHEQSEALWRRALGVATGLTRVRVLANLALYDTRSGPGEAFRTTGTCADEALRQGQLWSARITLLNLASRYWVMGQGETSAELTGASLRMSVAAGARLEAGFAIANLAHMDLVAGEVDRALDRIRLAEALGGGSMRERTRVWIISYMVHAQLGDFSEAARHARRAADLLEASHVPDEIVDEARVDQRILERTTCDETTLALLQRQDKPRLWQLAWQRWGVESTRQAGIASCRANLARMPDEESRRVLEELTGEAVPRPPPLPPPSALVQSWMTDPEPVIDVIRRWS